MENAVELINVSKKYKNFSLDKINFAVPKGTVVGFIGRNGAGKTTTVKSILNLISYDGKIKIFGKDSLSLKSSDKEKIGVVFDECCFPTMLKVKELEIILSKSYKNWDKKLFDIYTEKFSLPQNMKIESYSRGMKMKLEFAVAVSHHSELYILDEATSGLDPVMKDELLDILRDLVTEKGCSVLMSSHILSDIEYLCDFVAFIDNGKLLLYEEKDELIDKFAIVKCSQKEFEDIDGGAVIGKTVSRYGVEALVIRDKVSDYFQKEKADLECIMRYMLKGEKDGGEN